MADTHFTAPCLFIDVGGDRFAYRRWGNPATLMTDGLADGRGVILCNGRGAASSFGKAGCEKDERGPC